ncbi:MarR family winged helix-turn-helix transcriptional regulator [Arthrobacter russicus]|jgi:DNA-binding MarR family transcriptional regulator|uniref:DNA-binding MarR family transcriptional regulator n=1 Tax=Arthrobacter russicus TaxID=172040 RepID=A0ABU1J8V0_9MICC|nr:MarR family transcriptional regulator [Arthrobacter russicus]MDN5669459.1 MarR family transcriptional regulator [Renibacterium salmoninarum]MDR6268798.1 DNA-binding MarR family transcriptional regulator [Arthrobacter russicus]
MNEAEANNPDHGELSEQLLRLLQEFTVQTDHFVEEVSHHNGLHRTDLNALAHLAKMARSGEAATPGKLGQALNLSSPATTALIDRLTRAGHLERHRDAADRRQVHLRSTEKAQGTGRALFGPLAKHLSRAMAGYTDEELQLVARFIIDMTTATETAKSAVVRHG